MKTQWSTTRQPKHPPRVDILSHLDKPMKAQELADKLHYSAAHLRRELIRLEITGAVIRRVMKRFGESPVYLWEKV